MQTVLHTGIGCAHGFFWTLDSNKWLFTKDTIKRFFFGRLDLDWFYLDLDRFDLENWTWIGLTLDNWTWLGFSSDDWMLDLDGLPGRWILTFER